MHAISLLACGKCLYLIFKPLFFFSFNKLTDWQKHFCWASHISSLISKFPSALDLFSSDVPGLISLSFSGFFLFLDPWFFLRLNFCSFPCWPQALTIIAFNHGNLSLDTFKEILSVGPSFAVMNFIESMLSLKFLELAYQMKYLNKSFQYSFLFSFVCWSLVTYAGCLDVLLMFGAYSSARGMAISRLVIRFFWCGLSSVFVTYLYVWVVDDIYQGMFSHALSFCSWVI